MISMPKNHLFRNPELSGRSGLEATYNHILAGRNGSRLLRSMPRASSMTMCGNHCSP